MTAFDLTTYLFDYFRRTAVSLGCNPCFDDKQEELQKMNEKGEDGKPACLCGRKGGCPCEAGKKEIEKDGICYCEIFKKVL